MKREVLNVNELRLWNYETQTMKNAFECYLDSKDYELWHVYGSYSNAKESAWEYCKMLCRNYGGRCLKIISHNSMMFTAGFTFDHPETGVLCFCYITKSYDRFMYV